MNATTGQVYSPEVELYYVNDRMALVEENLPDFSTSESEDMTELRKAVARGEHVFPIGEEAAHKLRLGGRELERRRARRKSARRARRNNRR